MLNNPSPADSSGAALPPVVYFSGCFGLHSTFKVRGNIPLAWEQEAAMAAVPGDSA